jgi:hypothetical protein
VQTSPLETRLKSREIPWTPSWQLLSATRHNIFGAVTSRACGDAPPIYRLQMFPQAPASSASDEELRAFVRIMESGTEIQKLDAVDAALSSQQPR